MLMHALLRNLWTQLWLTGVVCLVLLALYTSLGRQLIPLVETLKEDVEVGLSQQLGVKVQLESLQGDWLWFSPRVKVHQATIGEGVKALKVQRLEAELNVSASIFYRVPVFEQITLAGVHLPFTQDENNDWQLGSFALPSSNEGQEDSASAKKPLWLDLLGQQGEIHLFNWHIDIQRYGKPVKAIKLLDLRLRNNGLHHLLDGEIQLAETEAILRTQFEVEGDLWDLSKHNAKGYVELATQQWQEWIPDYSSQWQIDEVAAGARLWLEVEQGLLHKLDGYLDVPEFSLTQKGDDQTRNLSFQHGRITLAGRRDDQDWHLWFDTDFQWLSELAPPKPKGRISWLPNIAGGWQLALDDIDLASSSSWLESFNLLPEKYMAFITNLQPTGNIDQARVNLIPNKDWLWSASLDISGVNNKAWKGIPATEQLTGTVKLNAKTGVLNVMHQDTYLHFPELYQQGWLLEDTQAEIYWQIEDDYLRLVAPTIISNFQQAKLNGGFSFYTPLNESQIEPQLNLMLGIKGLSLLKQDQAIPLTAPKEITTWLKRNVKTGEAKAASFIYSGSVAEQPADFSQTIQIYADVQNTQMSYMPDWPEVHNIKANVMVDVPNVDVWLHKASTLGGELVPSSGRLKVRTNDKNETWLTMRGKMQGPAAEAVQYLQDTPLKQQVSGAFDFWSAKGLISSELYAQLPLTETSAKNKIRLTSDFHKVDADISDLNLSFANINGQVIFDSDEGLSASGIKANTFSGPSIADITSEVVNGGFDIQVNAKGSAQAASVKEWLPLFMFKPVSGEFDYQLAFNIRPPKRGGLEFIMESDLVGISIDTPAPFGKPAAEIIPYRLTVNKKRDLRIKFSYGELANGVMALEDGELQRGQVFLGTTQAFLPSDRGLSISGNIDHELDAKAWWDLWNKVKPAEQPIVDGEEKKPAVLTHVNISAPSVNAWQQPMGQSHIEGHHKWGRWQFDLDSELVKGKIMMPDDLVNNAIEMDLEYIHMPVKDNDPNKDIRFGAAGTVDPLAEFDPKWIPNTDMKVEEVFLGTSNYGRWDMTMRQQEDFTQIHIKDSYSKFMTMKGDINWSKDEQGHKTHLSLFRLSSKKLGDSQRAFRKAASIEAEKSKFDVDLTWRGSPAGFNYASLNGLAKINIKDGVLVSDNAGALKAFGVLNFNSISRRLQLDFSDLYEKGVVFDVLKTRLSFADGVATFADPLWIDGPSAKFQSSGLVNFNTEEIDQKLVVTFPITSSLPLVAVLAGLAPQIAGAIYVTEKLIGEELEQFTSASYTVSGTIENPKMKIDQAFDNELEGKESRSLKNRFLDIFGLGDDDD